MANPAGAVVSFGRRVSAEPRDIGEALQDGEDLRFTFEKMSQADSTPYWQQGNDDLDAPEALAMRAALKQDVRVKRELERFYKVYDTDSSGSISKEEYLKVHVKFALVLIPDITVEEATASGEADWKEDAGGNERMSREQLFSCLFELADLWCTGIVRELAASADPQRGADPRPRPDPPP